MGNLGPCTRELYCITMLISWHLGNTRVSPRPMFPHNYFLKPSITRYKKRNRNNTVCYSWNVCISVSRSLDKTFEHNIWLGAGHTSTLYLLVNSGYIWWTWYVWMCTAALDVVWVGNYLVQAPGCWIRGTVLYLSTLVSTLTIGLYTDSMPLLNVAINHASAVLGCRSWCFSQGTHKVCRVLMCTRCSTFRSKLHSRHRQYQYLVAYVILQYILRIHWDPVFSHK